MDREDYTVVETVHQSSIIVFDAEAGLDQEFLLVAGSTRRFRQSPAAERGPSEPVFTYGLILEATASEILEGYVPAFIGLKAVLEEFPGIFRNQHETFMPLPLGDFLRTFLLLDDLDMIFLRKILQSFGIGHVLMLHHESHGRTRLAAAEALVYAL